MIRIDIDAAQLARHPVAVALRGAAAPTLAALHALLPDVTDGDGTTRAATTRTAALAELDPPTRHQLAMLEAIRSALPGAIIVGDSTQPIYAGNLYYDHDRAGGWFNAATGYGALGYGAPAAIGAAIAAPGRASGLPDRRWRPAILLAELMTAMDEGVGVTFLVWNNAGYREIADAMTAAGTQVLGCDPTPPLFAQIAAACRMPFASIAAEPEALRAALAGPQTGPRMIEIRVP